MFPKHNNLLVLNLLLFLTGILLFILLLTLFLIMLLLILTMILTAFSFITFSLYNRNWTWFWALLLSCLWSSLMPRSSCLLITKLCWYWMLGIRRWGLHNIIWHRLGHRRSLYKILLRRHLVNHHLWHVNCRRTVLIYSYGLYSRIKRWITSHKI